MNPTEGLSGSKALQQEAIQQRHPAGKSVGVAELLEKPRNARAQHGVAFDGRVHKDRRGNSEERAKAIRLKKYRERLHVVANQQAICSLRHWSDHID